MKITFFASGSVRSNFTYRILALAQSLHKRGHDVAIVAPKADKYNNFTPEAISEIDGVRILQPFQFATRRLEINLIPYLFGAAKALFAERPDVVYIYKPTPISIVGLLGKCIPRATIITDFDDLGSEVMKIEGHPFHQRKLVEWSERLAARHANRIVAASQFLFDTYRLQYPAKPMYLLPNGVDAEWFTEPIVATDKKQIVFMGAMNRTSILEPLFDALPDIVSAVPSVEVIMMGDGKYLSYFKDKAHKRDLDTHVRFTGWLDLTSARKELKENAIGYSYMPNETTVRAASNMKVSQYMARGVVPLVSDVSELATNAEFLKAGYAALAGDGEALKATLIAALNDPTLADHAAHARAFAKKHFDWDVLATGFDAWLNGKRTSDKKLIYVISTTVPEDVGGGEIRNFNLLKQLKRTLNADIKVFGIAPNDRELDIKKAETAVNAQYIVAYQRPRTLWTMLRALDSRVPPFMDDFKSTGVGEMLANACRDTMPDFVQIEQLDAYYCVRPYIPWLKSNGVKIVFDCHNIEHKLFSESLKLFTTGKKLAGKLILPNMKRLEIEAIKNADIVLACSPLDMNFFKEYNANIHLIPNGTDVGSFAPKQKTEKPVLIFIGGVGYPPNGDAMEYYLRSIHPKVKSAVPNVELLAVGTTADWLSEKGLTDSSVKPLGFVQDIRPYLQGALVGICPLRYGSGTRIKIMTYMASGLAVVATTKGAEGVSYEPGRDLMIADSEQAFASDVIELLQNEKHRTNLAQNGYDFITKYYDWNVIGEHLKPIYQ